MADELKEGSFVDGWDAELGGFVGLSLAGLRAGNKGGGGFCDGTGDGGAEFTETILGSFAAHTFEGAGDNITIAGKREIGRVFGDRFYAELLQFGEEFQVIFIGKVR